MPVIRTDPLRNFKFRVQIVPEQDSGLNQLAQGIGNLGFAQMSGIAVTNEVIPYREGGMNTHPHKMVGQSDFAPVSLARGVFPGGGAGNGESLAAWQLFMHTWQGGHETGGAATVTGDGHPVAGSTTQAVDTSEYRCTVNIFVYDHPVTTGSYAYDTDPSSGVSGVSLPRKLGITLYNAWPGSFSISDLNAGDNGILIQQLQLHHEGFSMDWAPPQG